MDQLNALYSRLDALAGIMPVTSTFYLAFLALVVVVFYALRNANARAAWLLVASIFFYALLTPRALVVVLAFAAFAYGAALFMGGAPATDGTDRAGEDEAPAPTSRTRRGRRLALYISVTATVGALVYFKAGEYLLSLIARIPAGADLVGTSPALALAMPIGVSFWTFQLVAYLVDVYRGTCAPVRNPLKMALAVLFFPIVTIGPITKVDSLAEQFSHVRRFDFERLRSALLLVGWGFFKKLVIADRLAVFVGSVYGNVNDVSGMQAGLIFFVATAFYAIQLYADFSGYTDIVRGSARLMGVELPQNFAAPYLSRTISEFWRRWHMTLMDWLKRYIYIPLGGNRKGALRKRANLLAVFAISGLWHGPGLTFLIWGLLNGVYSVAGEVLAPLNQRVTALLKIDRDSAVHRAFQRLVTFGLITVSWVFFRAESLHDALRIVARMFIPTVWIFSDGMMLEQGLSQSELEIALLATLVLFVVDYLRYERKVNITRWLTSQHVAFRWLVYYALILLIVVFGYYGGSGTDASAFVYFRF